MVLSSLQLLFGTEIKAPEIHSVFCHTYVLYAFPKRVPGIVAFVSNINKTLLLIPEHRFLLLVFPSLLHLNR